MSHMSTTIRVEAPAEVVYDIVADPARGLEWQTLIGELRDVAGRPGGVGSSYTGYYKLAGRMIAGRFIVTASERPALHQVAGTTRGGWARWTTMIEPIDGGATSEVRVALEYEMPGEVVGSLVGIVAGGRLAAEFERSYANLKRIAESAAAAKGPGGDNAAA